MFKGKISAFKNRLTTVGSEEPLNKLALAVIILLDLFVLSILFAGLEDHTKQLISPNEYMPRIARQVFIDQAWSPSVRLSKLQPLVLSDRKGYSTRYRSMFAPEKLEPMHPLCRDFYEKIHALSKDKSLVNLFVERDLKTKERSRVRSSQDKAKRAYDTQLLETIAGKESANTASIAARSQNLTAQIELLTGQIDGLEKQINAHPGIQEIWTLSDPQNQNRPQVVKAYQSFERWYLLRELLWQLLFLLPIFGGFYFWSERSVKKDNRIQTLIASHLLVVAFIPILIKLVELVVDLIPDHFFKALFRFLRSLHLIAIWHYLVILGAVAFGLFLVYLIQKKVFNREKVIQKRLSKGACIQCGKKLPVGASACAFCGTNQSEDCTACSKPTPVGGTYCIHCGEKTTNGAGSEPG